jgi:hypothetical protein
VVATAQALCCVSAWQTLCLAVTSIFPRAPTVAPRAALLDLRRAAVGAPRCARTDCQRMPVGCLMLPAIPWSAKNVLHLRWRAWNRRGEKKKKGNSSPAEGPQWPQAYGCSTRLVVVVVVGGVPLSRTTE